jgi:hypothetical protein
MTAAYDVRPMVLGIYPMAQGFGWAVFESPLALVQCRLFLSPKGSPDAWLKRADQLMGFFKPEAVVVEAFDPSSTDRHAVVERVGKRIVDLATDRGCVVEILTRQEVGKALGRPLDADRRSIAHEVAARIPTLGYRVPKPRTKFGDGEPRSLSVFSAAALVLAHYENEATALLDELRDAA